MALGRTLALLVALPLTHAQLGCSDECVKANNSVCNDGGSAASNGLCAYGTDCNDCGAREQALECSGPRLGTELAESLWGVGSGYDKHVRPAAASAWRDRAAQHGSHWPLEKDHVSVQMQLLSISSVSTKLQMLEVELYLRVVWYDWRLRFNTTLDGGCIQEGAPCVCSACTLRAIDITLHAAQARAFLAGSLSTREACSTRFGRQTSTLRTSWRRRSRRSTSG